jgi:hypothetical protein
MRKYSNAKHNAATIANEVVTEGCSGGWCGDTDALDEIKRLLAPFNIGYVDDFTGRWAKIEPKPAAPAEHDYERRGMRVIMRWEGAKQPASLPQAVILFEHGGEYVVSYEYQQPDGKWSRDGGSYFNPKSYEDEEATYDAAVDEFTCRVDQRSKWYTKHACVNRIEQFIK